MAIRKYEEGHAGFLRIFDPERLRIGNLNQYNDEHFIERDGIQYLDALREFAVILNSAWEDFNCRSGQMSEAVEKIKNELKKLVDFFCDLRIVPPNSESYFSNRIMTEEIEIPPLEF